MKASLKKIICVLLIFAVFLSFGGCQKKDTESIREELGGYVNQIIHSSGYSTQSYEAYMSALENARAVYDDQNADEERLLASLSSIKNAIKGLIPTADFLVLQTLVATEYPEVNYTTESYSAYVEALEKAKAVCSDPSSKQAIVDSAVEVLQYAIFHLTRKADPSVLGALVASPIPDTGYTGKSYARYQSVLQAATELYARRVESMTQTQAEEYAEDLLLCTAELEYVIADLTKKGNCDSLRETYYRWLEIAAEASSETDWILPEKYYTFSSFSRLNVTLTEVAAILASGDCSQDELDHYESLLNTYGEALQKRADPSDLEDMVTSATTYYLAYPDLYSEETYLTLVNAVNVGKDLVNSPEATQEELDEATDRIVIAIASLEVVGVRPDGNTDNRFTGAAVVFSTVQTTLGAYFTDNSDFLMNIALLASEDVSVANTEELMIVETADGIHAEFKAGGITYTRSKNVTDIPAGKKIVTVAGIYLGMTQTDVSAVLDNAPTISSDEEGNIVQTYADGESGIAVTVCFENNTGLLYKVQCGNA